jgi:hypothetical protein
MKPEGRRRWTMTSEDRTAEDGFNLREGAFALTLNLWGVVVLFLGELLDGQKDS